MNQGRIKSLFTLCSKARSGLFDGPAQLLDWPWLGHKRYWIGKHSKKTRKKSVYLLYLGTQADYSERVCQKDSNFI